MTLHLIMPSRRYWNIGRIATAWMKEAEPHSLELRWHIGIQNKIPDAWGMDKTNELIDLVPGQDWLMLLSDDSCHHPALFRRIEEVIKANPEKRAIIFSEQRQPAYWVLHAAPQNMRPCYCDGQQLVVRKDFLGDLRYNREKYGNQADGNLIQQLYQSAPDNFVFVPEILLEFGANERL